MIPILLGKIKNNTEKDILAVEDIENLYKPAYLESFSTQFSDSNIIIKPILLNNRMNILESFYIAGCIYNSEADKTYSVVMQYAGKTPYGYSTYRFWDTDITNTDMLDFENSPNIRQADFLDRHDAPTYYGWAKNNASETGGLIYRFCTVVYDKDGNVDRKYYSEQIKCVIENGSAVFSAYDTGMNDDYVYKVRYGTAKTYTSSDIFNTSNFIANSYEYNNNSYDGGTGKLNIEYTPDNYVYYGYKYKGNDFFGYMGG